jgi:hypothetical protein
MYVIILLFLLMMVCIVYIGIKDVMYVNDVLNWSKP